MDSNKVINAKKVKHPETPIQAEIFSTRKIDMGSTELTIPVYCLKEYKPITRPVTPKTQ